jgi:hypothetical protein
VLPFWISIALLSLAQGALVALPGVLAWRPPARLSGRRWAIVPPLSVIAFVFGARAAESASAQALTYLALCAVPVLAALALGWLLWGARPPLARRLLRAALVAPLFALAWADRGGLAGEAAALVLSALSCAALGVLLATVTPPRWLAAGVVAMAIADTTLVVSDLLQRPNNALNAAHPVANLPQLQSEALGSAVMGYGDLFVAGAFGGLLAVTVGRATHRRAAALAAALALTFDLLFFLVEELPATVPIALALVIVVLSRRLRSAPGQGSRLARRSALAPAPHPRTPAAP